MKVKFLLLLLVFTFNVVADTALPESKIYTAIENSVADFAKEHRFSGSVLVSKGDKIIYQFQKLVRKLYF